MVWQRQSHSPSANKCQPLRSMSPRLAILLPLPTGEGRGEGEGRARITCRARTQMPKIKPSRLAFDCTHALICRAMNEDSSSESLPPVIESASSPPAQRRLGWWIQLLLIAALPVAVFVLGMGRSPMRGPALTHSVTGLLYVCSVQIGVFALLLLLAVVASRPSSHE